MKNLISRKTAVSFFVSIIVLFASCTSSKKPTQEPEKKLPGTVAITPSSFRCSGNVIESRTESLSFVVKEITERGSSLFYAVHSGDTIEAVFLSPNKNTFQAEKLFNFLIEERLKMNSEKPEFIVKHIE